MDMDAVNIDVAILVPGYNEELTIAKVARDFRHFVPGCDVFVYDNASSDRTAEMARAAGAIVRREPLAGKGNVVRRMFADVEADVYVLVDGDDTYDAASAPALIEKLVTESLDLVTAARSETVGKAYRRGPRFGNWMLTALVARLFGNRCSDMLSGYRVLSRRFVKSFPALSSGFEIETELTVHALQVRVPIAEVLTPYKNRPAGSHSKLRTVSDGARILSTIAKLVKEERPMYFFGVFGALFGVLSLLAGYPVVTEYLRTGLVPRLPTAVLATGLTLLGSLSLVCGLILDTVTKGRLEQKRMHYLSIPIRFRDAARRNAAGRHAARRAVLRRHAVRHDA
jgi:glycosyltransferase involved in cell wall biosynthesis